MAQTCKHTILVTGAGGFIGSSVATALEQAGYAVRRGVRRPGESGTLCDLDRPDTVAEAVRGVDLVVHAAYGETTHMVQQCRALLTAMAAADVPRLIHLSSIAVYGDAAGLVGENTPLRAVDAYGLGKIDCEAAVREWTLAPDGSGRRALVLRPGIVYGRGSPLWIEKMADRIRLRAWGTFGAAGEGLAALVHVSDVAGMIVTGAGVLCAAPCTTHSAPTVLNVVGPETPSWNAYFTSLARAMGAPALPVLEGGGLKLRQGLSIGARVWRKLGLPGAAGLALTPLPGEIALFSRKADYRTPAAAAFGYAPRITLDEGLPRSLDQAKA